MILSGLGTISVTVSEQELVPGTQECASNTGTKIKKNKVPGLFDRPKNKVPGTISVPTTIESGTVFVLTTRNSFFRNHRLELVLEAAQLVVKYQNWSSNSSKERQEIQQR